MRTLLVLGLIAAVGPMFAADEKDPTAGKWVVQSVTRNGKDSPELKGAFREQGDGKYVLLPAPTAAKKAERTIGNYTIDATKTPMTIDMTPKGGTYDGKTLLGIVKVEGDTLTICFAEPGKDRPTKFESKEGSGHVLAVHKRAK